MRKEVDEMTEYTDSGKYFTDKNKAKKRKRLDCTDDINDESEKEIKEEFNSSQEFDEEKYMDMKIKRMKYLKEFENKKKHKEAHRCHAYGEEVFLQQMWKNTFQGQYILFS